jgi:hypothetical protein
MSSLNAGAPSPSSPRPAMGARVVILYLGVGLLLAAVATWLMGAIF